jgi:two-component system, OmpR family, phosphate regulon response regulator OmpR
LVEQKHLLLVDDDKGIRELLKKYLVRQGFLVSEAKSVDMAREIMGDLSFDLVILDVMMPKEDGLSMASSIRLDLNNVPIIMLTAMGEVKDRINGLEVGADDYISKPFEPKELLLRIKKLLQRTSVEDNKGSSLINMGSVSYSTYNRQLIKNGQNVPITSSEANLLDLLVQSKGKLLAREDLARKCGNINERSIDVQIIRLRSKIEINPKKPVYLQTLRGKGYVLYCD